MMVCVCLSLNSGLGYILGSSAKVAAGDWHWALRVRASPNNTAHKHAHRDRRARLGSGVRGFAGDGGTGGHAHG